MPFYLKKQETRHNVPQCFAEDASKSRKNAVFVSRRKSPDDSSATFLPANGEMQTTHCNNVFN